MTKISLNGMLVEAERINVETSDESWNIYELEDGTELRVKLVLASVVRIKDKYSKTGEPVYLIKTETVIDPRVPDELLKPVEG